MTKLFVAFAGTLDTIDSVNQTAVFTLMMEGVGNLKRQGLTGQDMDKVFKLGLPSAPICVNADYTPGHEKLYKVPVAHWEKRANGQFYDKKDGLAIGTAAITDPEVIKLLETGELGPISWNMLYTHSQCSECHEKLPDNNWENHSHIKTGSAYAQLQNARLVSFDFVPRPAYPEAGFKQFTTTAGSSPENLSDKAHFLKACAGEFELSQQKLNQKTRDEKNKMSENQDLTNRLTKIEKLLETNAGTIDSLVKTVTELKESKTTIDAISKQMKTQADNEHALLVEEAYKYRAAAGMSVEETAEKTKLNTKTNDELKENIADAKTVIAKNNPETNPTNPTLPQNNMANAGTKDLNKLLEEATQKYGY